MSWNCWPGQPVRLGQIVNTPSSGFTVGVPHRGHFFGGLAFLSRFPLRFWITGETTCGMTSPARITITSSPSRTSLRSRSSSLWRVAVVTVTPLTWTASSIANGSRCPVRPTFQTILFSFVVAVDGGNFHATAQRGSRPATPSSRCRPRSSTLTTTPSISKSSWSRRSSHQLAALGDLVDALVQLHLVVDRKAPLAEPFEHLAVAVGLPAAAGADAVGPQRERARGGDLRIELAQRAGGGVARVREGRLSRLRALCVELGEGRDRAGRPRP